MCLGSWKSLVHQYDGLSSTGKNNYPYLIAKSANAGRGRVARHAYMCNYVRMYILIIIQL